MQAHLRWMSVAASLVAADALAAPCGVPATHASLALALADTACDPINVAAGDHLVSAGIDRPLTIVGAGSTATRVYAAQPGSGVFTLGPLADLSLQGLQLLVHADTPGAIAVSQQSGAQLALSDVGIGNAVPPSQPLVFANGFE